MSFDELTKKFKKVVRTLEEMGEGWAVVKAYKKPWKFYRENEETEIIKILISESQNNKEG